MNKTQGKWYDGLKCPRPPYIPYNDEYVILSSVAGGVTSFASIVWFFKKIWQKRREHYAEIAGEPEPGNGANTANASTRNNDSLIVLE